MTRIITHFMTHSKPVFGQECANIGVQDVSHLNIVSRFWLPEG